jgi:hypothetical protein
MKKKQERLLVTVARLIIEAVFAAAALITALKH